MVPDFVSIQMFIHAYSFSTITQSRETDLEN